MSLNKEKNIRIVQHKELTLKNLRIVQQKELTLEQIFSKIKIFFIFW